MGRGTRFQIHELLGQGVRAFARDARRRARPSEGRTSLRSLWGRRLHLQRVCVLSSASPRCTWGLPDLREHVELAQESPISLREVDTLRARCIEYDNTFVEWLRHCRSR